MHEDVQRYIKRRYYRIDNEPYSFDSWSLHSNDKAGYVVKEREVFDGKEVKWYVYQEYKDDLGNKHYNFSPAFENVIDEEMGMDRLRFLYKNEDGIFFIARLNGNDVLYRQNLGDTISTTDFGKIEDFGGDKVTVEIVKPNKIRGDYSKNGRKRVILFSFDTFKPYSNEFNGLYEKEKYFLKSYPVDKDDVNARYIVGKIDRLTGEVSPIAYDLCSKEYIELPITEEGLIDDDIMLKQSKNVSGYPRSVVEKEKIYWYLCHALELFDIEEDECDNIMEELDNRNKERQR